ncbi:MAG TPA: periplasmic heavy metal sensor [Myxococcota bacterium]|jgi:Spy/CpxP family protein refolding chaperone
MSGIERDEFGAEPIGERQARRRAFWLGLAAAGLAAAVASAIALGAAGEARATRGFFGRAHGPHGHGEGRLEAAREHAELAAEWLLRSVDASEQQQARVREIVGASLGALAPLADQHRAHHQALAELLAQETIDRAALESLRAQELGLLEQASRTLTAGVADVAETLTASQRAELLEFASRFHR